jgi:4-diphosphocytidyl-2-C-methyl-D-erythritol kinase
MTSLTLPAPAKLNLFLHITGRRPDGYHELQTVFQLLDYGDELTFNLADDDLSFSCSHPDLETPDNLVMRAARLLWQETGIVRGTRIHLDKRLPTGGGVGGGSSDAATTLVALNRLWECGLDTPALASLGLSLGADLPVFIQGHSAWAEGVGEILQPIDLPHRWYLVLTPDCHVSTEVIFGHSQLTRDTHPLKIAGFPFSGSKNDCESLVSDLYSPVKKALDWLSGYGQSRLTGTGASVFAAFETEAEARHVMALVPEKAPEKSSAFVARGVNISPLQKVLAEA